MTVAKAPGTRVISTLSAVRVAPAIPAVALTMTFPAGASAMRNAPEASAMAYASPPSCPCTLTITISACPGGGAATPVTVPLRTAWLPRSMTSRRGPDVATSTSFSSAFPASATALIV